MLHTESIEDFARRSLTLIDLVTAVSEAVESHEHICGPAIQAGAGPAA